MYRNDHDAALARIDALETELEQSRVERERLSTQLAHEVHPSSHWPRRIALALLVGALFAVGAVRLHRMVSTARMLEPVVAEQGVAYDDPVHRVCALP